MDKSVQIFVKMQLGGVWKDLHDRLHAAECKLKLSEEKLSSAYSMIGALESENSKIKVEF